MKHSDTMEYTGDTVVIKHGWEISDFNHFLTNTRDDICKK